MNKPKGRKAGEKARAAGCTKGSSLSLALTSQTGAFVSFINAGYAVRDHLQA